MIYFLTLLAGAAGQDYEPFTQGGAETGQVSAPLYVILAYSIIWLVLLFFVASVWKRQKVVERDLEDLRRELSE